MADAMSGRDRSVQITVSLTGDKLTWAVEIETHPTDMSQIVGRGETLADAAEDAATQLRTHKT